LEIRENSTSVSRKIILNSNIEFTKKMPHGEALNSIDT